MTTLYPRQFGKSHSQVLMNDLTNALYNYLEKRKQYKETLRDPTTMEDIDRLKREINAKYITSADNMYMQKIPVPVYDEMYSPEDPEFRADGMYNSFMNAGIVERMGSPVKDVLNQWLKAITDPRSKVGDKMLEIHNDKYPDLNIDREFLSYFGIK